jgi:hypothetical protein
MKKTSVLMVAVAALLLIATGALASSVIRIRASVPFSFYVGDEQLPAGNYIFEMRAIGFGSSSSSAVAVYRQDGSVAAMISTIPSGWEYHRMADGHLHFTRYSNSYFLNKVEGPGAGASLITTKAERELRAQNNRGSETVIVAQRRGAQTQNP